MKKEVLDRRNVIKKKLGLIYAYDSTMNLGYDDDAKTFQSLLEASRNGRSGQSCLA